MVTTAPQSEKGNGYLRTGNNFWMYRQNTRTFQHINRDESINGTDTKAGDFERKKTTELYKPFVDANGKEDITEDAFFEMENIKKVQDDLLKLLQFKKLTDKQDFIRNLAPERLKLIIRAYFYIIENKAQQAQKLRH